MANRGGSWVWEGIRLPRFGLYWRVCSGRWNPGHTDAIPAHASWIGDVASWVPAELSGSESRAPDLGDNGCLSIGPYEGVKAQLPAEKSGVHTVQMPSSGFSDILKKMGLNMCIQIQSRVEMAVGLEVRCRRCRLRLPGG